MILVQSSPAVDFSREILESVSPIPILRYEELPGGELLIEFDGVLTEEQIDALSKFTRQSTTRVNLQKAAQAALQTNEAWRTGVYPQIISGADAIINAPTSSIQERQLAQGFKLMVNQMSVHSTEIDALINLVLDQLHTTD